MKTALIVVLSVLIAISGGLLVYGASLGTPETFSGEFRALGEAPDASIYANVEQWYDMSTIYGASTGTKADKAAQMLVYATYNHIYAKQWLFTANVDMYADAVGLHVNSQYFHAQQREFNFHQSLAYTGTINAGSRRVYYGNQKIEQTSISVMYDEDESTYTAQWGKPTAKSADPGLKSENPYAVYSWFDLPIYLGNDGDEEGTDIDSSFINNSSVQITAPKSGAQYYTVKFNVDTVKANNNKFIKDKLSESSGDGIMSNIKFNNFSFEIQIWSCGLIRSISCEANVIAKAKGKTGACDILRDYQFSYDNVDTSVAYWLKTFDMTSALNGENHTKYQNDIALIESELDAE